MKNLEENVEVVGSKFWLVDIAFLGATQAKPKLC
jgi:hypothetical protein